MALSSRGKNKLVDQINTVFKSIGNAAGMKMPRSESNLAPYAWEYWVACHVASLANKRKENAERAAVNAGVLIDKEKNPKPPGTRDVIYHDDVSIILEVRKPSERVDAEKMIDHLVAAGVKESVARAAKHAATTETRPAHVFTAYLVTEETNGK